jgi:hypothetical protein
LLIIPAIALAHGEEVIYTFFIQIISIIICLIIIVALKGNNMLKSILLGVYFASVIAVFCIVNVVPFRDNMQAINLSVAFVPAIMAALTYFLLKFGLNKDKRK